MQHELRIAFRNMDVSEALEKRIRARVADLDQLCDRITACDVVVEMQHRHQSHGKTFQVRVDLALPGRTIVVRREPGAHYAHEDAHVAVRDAFDSARRQLEDYVHVVRGEVKTHLKAAPAE
jgi:ribosomal subunit interface protein